jgi:hypothetical protein
MGQFESFAQVLEQTLENRLRKEIKQEIETEIQREIDAWLEQSSETTTATGPHSPSTARLDNSPDCLAALLGIVQPLRQNPEAKAHLYHRHRPKVRPTPRPRPAHALSETQVAALHFFRNSGQSELQSNYSMAELKTAFRHLALRFHPDRPQGSAALFIQLKNAYDCLRLVFKR